MHLNSLNAVKCCILSSQNEPRLQQVFQELPTVVSKKNEQMMFISKQQFQLYSVFPLEYDTLNDVYTTMSIHALVCIHLLFSAEKILPTVFSVFVNPYA